MQDDTKEQKKVPTPIQDMIEDAQKDGTTGPLIGSIIIIVIMIIGGLYFWSSLINQKTSKIIETETTEAIQNQMLIKETVKQSDSEDIDTIEADLEATNFDVLDDIIQDIEKEL